MKTNHNMPVPFTFEVRTIVPKDTYKLRFKVLRPHQSIEACHYPGDFESFNFHIGAFHKERLISIASFFKENHPQIKEKTQYRLRGMATLKDFRTQKAGSSIIAFGEDLLRKKKVDAWWCNARITAADYYLKMGFCQIGDIYEIKPIGMHKLMYKSLNI